MEIVFQHILTTLTRQFLYHPCLASSPTSAKDFMAWKRQEPTTCAVAALRKVTVVKVARSLQHGLIESRH